MGFTNYLTSYRLHLSKHVKNIFTMSDTSGLTEAEVKSYVEKLKSGALPIPNETFEWLASFFQYVQDKDQMLVYDNANGIWVYEPDDMTLRSMLLDYFTTIAEEALPAKDAVSYRYASSFFAPGKVVNLAQRVKGAATLKIARASSLIDATENYRYFETVAGTRALLDLREPKFNLKTVKMSETQPLHLTSIHPVPIAVTDEAPTLWLSLIEDYMMHDKDRIEYFHRVLAYLMSPYNYNQVLVYFVGDGRNGKGTVVKVLQDILGPHAVRMNSELLDAKPASSFKKDDALAATEGKSLLIFNEIDERMIASTQAIKDLTEGGRDEFGNKIMTVVRPAYSRNYGVNICGTPLIIANNLLNFGDWSVLDPIFKRLILVPFDFKIKVEDPTILNKLAQEYPKIQAWLYMNYYKYRGQSLKTVTKPVDFERRFVQFKEDSDIIAMFWKDCVSVTGQPSDDMLKSDLYRMYEKYCRVNGRMPIRNKGTNGFQNVIQPYVEQLVKITKQGSFYFRGIRRSVYFDKEVNNVV